MYDVYECCTLHELIVPRIREAAVLSALVQPSQVRELRVAVGQSHQVAQTLQEGKVARRTKLVGKNCRLIANLKAQLQNI